MILRPVNSREQEGPSNAVSLPGVRNGDRHLEAGITGFQAEVADDSAVTQRGVRRQRDKTLAVLVVRPAQEAGGVVADATGHGMEAREPAIGGKPGVEPRELEPVGRSDRPDKEIHTRQSLSDHALSLRLRRRRTNVPNVTGEGAIKPHRQP